MVTPSTDLVLNQVRSHLTGQTTVTTSAALLVNDPSPLITVVELRARSTAGDWQYADKQAGTYITVKKDEWLVIPLSPSAHRVVWVKSGGSVLVDWNIFGFTKPDTALT